MRRVKGARGLNITITDSAIEELNKKIGEQNGILKIKYEIDEHEFFGCAGGMPTLWFVSSAEENDDLLFDTNNRPVLMEKSKLLFFEKELKIDFSITANSFQLISPQRIINGRMSLINKVK
ncbi:iron-sulfur cluster biosynthesis family protein [Bacillus sp. OK048]|uniref:iron-sulfur cluster biosynthesis family protein n=1 Tax=Bacillus sp. OK048 TaxID=1882761 RepID=UPI0020C90D5E|nr:iron-sulfur cluster biosynthesis family protein [Bacillus sp. OK048]